VRDVARSPKPFLLARGYASRLSVVMWSWGTPVTVPAGWKPALAAVRSRLSLSRASTRWPSRSLGQIPLAFQTCTETSSVFIIRPTAQWYGVLVTTSRVCAILDNGGLWHYGVASEKRSLGDHVKANKPSQQIVEEGTRQVRTLWRGDWLEYPAHFSFTENDTDPTSFTSVGNEAHRIQGRKPPDRAYSIMRANRESLGAGGLPEK
jgi:hypothetical protein